MAESEKDLESRMTSEETAEAAGEDTANAEEINIEDGCEASGTQTAEEEETSGEAEDISCGNGGLEEETEEDKVPKKKGFFKKDKKDKKDEKIAELNDRVIRQMAEFDNFRKRTEKEKEQMYGIGAADVIEKLLPVIDNFERGLQAMTDEDKAGGFAQGIEMIYKQLMTVLEGLGVTPIEALGNEFDPNFHNAVMQQPSEDYESGIVMQELQKGYLYKEKVIRHSMVMVAE